MQDSKVVSDDQIKEYIRFRAEVLIYENNEGDVDDVYKSLVNEYREYAEMDKTTSRELWVNDYQNYELEKQEFEQSKKQNEKLEKKESFKGHYKYKIPFDLLNASEDDFKAGVVRELAKDKHIFIRGESDAGKSHLATALFKIKLEDESNDAEFFYEEDFDKLNYDETLAEIDRIRNLNTIVFDDLGAVGLSVYKKNLLKGVLYYRFRTNKDTIICTNVEIDEYYDSRTGSKIVGACTIVNKTPTGTRAKNKKVVEI